MTSTATHETVLRSHPGAGPSRGEVNADRYVIITNGDDTYSLRDTVDQVWIEQGGREDMTYMEAHDLREEYRWS